MKESSRSYPLLTETTVATSNLQSGSAELRFDQMIHEVRTSGDDSAVKDARLRDIFRARAQYRLTQPTAAPRVVSRNGERLVRKPPTDGTSQSTFLDGKNALNAKLTERQLMLEARHQQAKTSPNLAAALMRKSQSAAETSSPEVTLPQVSMTKELAIHNKLVSLTAAIRNSGGKPSPEQSEAVKNILAERAELGMAPYKSLAQNKSTA